MGGALKGLERVGGSRIIDRVVSAIEMVTPDIVLSANHQEASTWLQNVAMMMDKSAGMGGISGVLAALSLQRNVLVVAWDMPFVTGELLKAIVDVAAQNPADAVVPQSNSPQGIEPFCAWYSVKTIGALDQFLASGGGSAREFLARLPRVHIVPLHVTATFGDPARLFFSVNTPGDLARARAMAERPQ